MNKLYMLAAAILLGVGAQSLLFGYSAPSSPEIDAGSAASALALLAGAVVVIRGRRR